MPFRGDIVLQGVSFAYDDAVDVVLDDLTVTIDENSMVGIVGTSGAGKSTLLDLILGLLSPTKGEIRRGERAIADDLAGWYRSLGVVPQDVFLLNDTLRANIIFNDSDAAVDELWLTQVLKMAQLDALIDELPAGLGTFVGERGTRLSGGQRQRVGIARALYRRPSLLVLDEATSALDSLTEREIARTIESLHGTMTVIIVAHRLSTVRNVDNLLFIENGHITASGTFDEVRMANETFARLAEVGSIG